MPSGRDVFGEATGLGATTQGKSLGPSFSDSKVGAAAAASAATWGGKPAPAPPGVPSLPGLPSPTPAPAPAPAQSVLGKMGMPGQPTAFGESEEDMAQAFKDMDPVYGEKTPAEKNATAMKGGLNDPSVDTGKDSGVGTGGSTGSPAGNTGATSPDQDNTGGLGAGSTAGDMAATGSAPGVGSGQNETSAGPGSNSGGGGGGGGGSSGPGTGAGQSDSGHGVGGSQGSENGQGGYMMGTADTGNDGDMMPDEPVDGPIHENEAVLPEDMRNDLGKDLLAEAISFYQDKGLTPRERKAALKDLFGEWASK